MNQMHLFNNVVSLNGSGLYNGCGVDRSDCEGDEHFKKRKSKLQKVRITYMERFR